MVDFIVLNCLLLETILAFAFLVLALIVSVLVVNSVVEVLVIKFLVLSVLLSCSYMEPYDHVLVQKHLLDIVVEGLSSLTVLSVEGAEDY